MPGKQKGTKNYNKVVLIDAVQKVKPTSTKMWAKAYVEYQRQSGDPTNREPEDVKRYVWETLCRRGRKPTGLAHPDPVTGRAQLKHS